MDPIVVNYWMQLWYDVYSDVESNVIVDESEVKVGNTKKNQKLSSATSSSQKRHLNVQSNY